MRSRLEADFASWLDGCGRNWQYEPQCFADETGQYLPDFLIKAEVNVARTYVEIKPTTFSEADAKALRQRMEIIWSSDPDCALNIVWWDANRHQSFAAWHSFQKGAGWHYWTRRGGFYEVA